MSHLSHSKRVIVCTFVALMSGFFGAYIGGQINLRADNHSCQTQPLGWREVCNAWVAPKAIWQGSTTGLWMGLLLGAFFSGLATHQTAKEKQASTEALTKHISLCGDEIEITPAQRQAIHNFLVLLTVKLGNSTIEKLSLDELKFLAAIAGKYQLIKQDVTLEEARQLLQTLDNKL